MRAKIYSVPAGFTEEAVVRRISEGRGYRYQAASLARYFGVPCGDMRKMLMLLAQKQRIRRIVEGGKQLFYLPTPQEEAAARAAHVRSASNWSSLSTLVVWRPGDPDPEQGE